MASETSRRQSRTPDTAVTINSAAIRNGEPSRPIVSMSAMNVPKASALRIVLAMSNLRLARGV